MFEYTASDGKVFTDRALWRAYEFETNYAIRDKNGVKAVKLPGSINGQPFDLSDLTKCEVMLLDHLDQVQVDSVNHCKIFIGPSSGSVFIRNCSDCTFTVACKQLRTRDCNSCTIYLYSGTDPVIETSAEMRFAPFNGVYPGLHKHFLDARLDPEKNCWSRIFDFNDADKSGRNWSILEREKEDPWKVNLEAPYATCNDLDIYENPVPHDAVYTISGDVCKNNGRQGQMCTFTFDTSQRDAQDAMLAMTTSNKASSEISKDTAPPTSHPMQPISAAEIGLKLGLESDTSASNAISLDVQSDQLNEDRQMSGSRLDGPTPRGMLHAHCSP